MEDTALYRSVDSTNNIESARICCFGCLAKENETALSLYSVRAKALKAVLQMEHVCLCYLCQNIAQRSDLFIQTVQFNQKLLENCVNITDSAIDIIRAQSKPLIRLVHSPGRSINISCEDAVIKNHPVIYDYNKKLSVEVEMKQEDESERDNNIVITQEYGDERDNDIEDYVKPGDKMPFVKQEENAYELNDLMNQEICIEVAPINIKRSHRKTGAKREKLGNQDEPEIKEIAKIEIIHITRQQCLDERAKMLLDTKYTSAMYKCEFCIKGFALEDTYDKHMEKHSEAMGDFECDVCRLRMNSDEKLQIHKKCHEVRYKCGECGLTRICRSTIKDHYTAFHCSGNYQYNCPHCLKDFKREMTLRKHIAYTHRQRERVTCAYCNKTYASKAVLKSHLINSHPKEVSAREKVNSCICKECGLAFPSPSALKLHNISHSDRRDYYCVECDKSFKCDSKLKRHLKTTAAHTSYVDLPLACQYCDKRFAERRNLDRHTNKIHLHIKPFKCDKCDKAYVDDLSLTVHKRRIHEGYKPPLKYQCPMCNKAFNRNKILKNHIRTHTGERPFQCSECPARFTQASILGTHVKLIHLNLTRDGRPKGVARLDAQSSIRKTSKTQNVRDAKCPNSQNEQNAKGSKRKTAKTQNVQNIQDAK